MLEIVKFNLTTLRLNVQNTLVPSRTLNRVPTVCLLTAFDVGRFSCKDWKNSTIVAYLRLSLNMARWVIKKASHAFAGVVMWKPPLNMRKQGHIHGSISRGRVGRSGRPRKVTVTEGPTDRRTENWLKESESPITISCFCLSNWFIKWLKMMVMN